MWNKLIDEFDADILDKAVLRLREDLSKKNVNHEDLLEQITQSYGVYINVKEIVTAIESAHESDNETHATTGLLVTNAVMLGILLGGAISTERAQLEEFQIPEECVQDVQDFRDKVAEAFMGETSGSIN